MNSRSEFIRGWVPGTLLTVVLIGMLIFVSWLNLSGGDYRIPDTGVIFEAKVTLDGKPIPHAFILLQGETMMAQGYIGENGKVHIESAPPGEVKVGINTAVARGNLMGDIMAASQGVIRDGKKVVAPVIVDVPGKYFDPGSSGITVNLVKGLNEKTLELSKK